MVVIFLTLLYFGQVNAALVSINNWINKSGNTWEYRTHIHYYLRVFRDLKYVHAE